MIDGFVKEEKSMSDMMTPISFDKLVNWILEEHKKYGTVFGEKHAYMADAE